MKKKDREGISVIYIIECAIVTAVLLCIIKVGFVESIKYLNISVNNYQIESGDYLGWLSISYSIIFLSTSLLGMLSDKGATVYWVNINEYVLVNPRFFNFFSLSTIGFVSLFVETIATLRKDLVLFFVCFIVGNISIIIIFYKMIGSNFNHRHLRKVLIKEYSHNVNKLSGIEKKGYFNEIFLGICKNTEIACIDGKCNVIDENMQFFFHTLIIDMEVELLEDRVVEIFKVLEQYNFLDRVIDYIWDNENEEIVSSCIPCDLKYVSSLICSKTVGLEEAWNRMKDSHFFPEIDRYINMLKDNAMIEYIAYCNENEEQYSGGDSFNKYRLAIIEVSESFLLRRNNADDMISFLCGRMRQLNEFDKYTSGIIFSEPEYGSDGSTSMYCENGDVLSFILQERKLMSDASYIYFETLENILFHEKYVVGTGSSGEYRYLVPPYMQKALFITLKKYILSVRLEEHELDFALDIMERIFLQRICDVEEKSRQIREIMEILSKRKYERYLELFSEKIYSFFNCWLDDINDDAQDEHNDYDRVYKEFEFVKKIIDIISICNNGRNLYFDDNVLKIQRYATRVSELF